MSQIRQIKKLDELMDGALTERFNREMELILENVFDPNTSPKQKRRISILIDIIPNERRDAAEFRVDVQSKPAPRVAIAQTVFLAVDDEGNVTATENTNQVLGQVDMEGEFSIPRIIDFSKAKAK